jgi:hypothetical protein
MRLLLHSFVLILATAVLDVPAHAQASRPERPYRGLFGSNTADLDQQLTASASVGGGYDDNLIADALGRNTPNRSDLNTSHRGGLGNGSAGLNYSLSRDRFSASASGGTSARYYPTFATKFIRREYASGALNVNIGKGLTAGAQANYRPYSLASMFPTVLGSVNDAAAFDEDFPSSGEHYVAYSGNVAFSHQLSPRTSFALDAGYRVRESSARAERFTSRSAGGRLTHGVTKDLRLRLGYHNNEARYGEHGPRPVNHVIDAGVDYRKALSISRRTSVSFSTGTSAVSRDLGERTRFHAIGSAELTHEIGRTWFTSLAYNRGVSFIDSWPEPVFSDSAILSLSGLLTRRTQFQASARAAKGNRGFSRDASGNLHTYYGSAGVSFALSRLVNTGVNYSYYNHRFPDSMVLAPGFPAASNRKSVRAYVSLWVPVFERSRRQ